MQLSFVKHTIYKEGLIEKVQGDFFNFIFETVTQCLYMCSAQEI